MTEVQDFFFCEQKRPCLNAHDKMLHKGGRRPEKSAKFESKLLYKSLTCAPNCNPMHSSLPLEKHGLQLVDVQQDTKTKGKLTMCLKVYLYNCTHSEKKRLCNDTQTVTGAI